MAVYSWGANSHGQLGLGFENELCATPQHVIKMSFNPRTICTIKGGGGHVLVLDSTGQLHSCGWNNHGQLGLNCTDNKNEFICIPKEYFNNAPVEHIACGWDMSGAITADKEVYLWGSNSFQQLGICRRGFSMVTRPLRLKLPQNEIPMQISFGLHFCCILTQNNIVYLLGKLKIVKSQPDLKITSMPFNNIEITKIQVSFQIDSIACGQKHFLLRSGSRVFGVGDNKFRQSNTVSFTDEIKALKAGWTHNGVLTEEGLIYLWGRNSYGQLATLPNEYIESPIKLNLNNDCKVQEFHLGSEHGLLVTNDKKLFTWGWNEHGNCGNGATENVYYPTLIDVSSSCKIAGTGAGFCYAVCDAIKS